jgi:hypothetical protein
MQHQKNVGVAPTTAAPSILSLFACEAPFIPGFHDQPWEDGPPWDWDDEHDRCEESWIMEESREH